MESVWVVDQCPEPPHSLSLLLPQEPMLLPFFVAATMVCKVSRVLLNHSNILSVWKVLGGEDEEAVSVYRRYNLEYALASKFPSWKESLKSLRFVWFWL